MTSAAKAIPNATGTSSHPADGEEAVVEAQTEEHPGDHHHDTREHHPDHLGGQARQRSGDTGDGQHPKPGQQTVAALTHQTDPGRRSPERRADQHGQWDGTVQGAVA